ncbi:MAG TPA: diguanylate cyclase [Candidatus Competibacteraceae bacterium]|nr:diguanylate cyclase [Candidatus Competibacteraceae bacterium]
MWYGLARLLLVFGLALLALALPSIGGAAPRLDRVSLQLKWKHQFQFAGYYAAVEKGFYRDAGLDVTLLEAPDNIEPAQAVLRGDAEFGIAASDLVLLRGQGRPVVALAAIYQHSPFILLALANRGIDSIHDLAGKRAMIEAHAAELLAYLAWEAVPASRMTLIPHEFSPSALLEGRVDVISAYSTDEPFLLQQAGQPYLSFNPRAGGIDFYGDTLFTTEEQLRRHPQRVRAFHDASLRGWHYALAHPEEMAALIYNKYSQRHSLDHLRFEAAQSQRLILPDVVQIGYMNPGRWQHIAEVYAGLGMVAPGLSLEGFLYDPALPPNRFWLYLALGCVIGTASIAVFIGVRLHQLRAALVVIARQRDLLDGLFEDMGLGIVVLDPLGKVLRFNCGFKVLTGYSEQEVRHLDDWLVRAYPDPEYRQTVMEAWQRDSQWMRIETPRCFSVMCRDGANKEIEFRYWRLTDGRTIVSMQDVTLRKQSETQLRALEKRYRNLVENAPFPIVISRIDDGIILYLNPQAARKLTVSRTYILGKSTQAFYVQPEERDQLIAQLLQQGFLQHREVRLRTAAGELFWANLSATLIQFEDQLAVFFAIIDISERKALEQRLQTLAITDELTGLYNRRHFTQCGIEEVVRAQRYSTPFSLLMLDIDHFKTINDTYGHESGDEMLRSLAGMLQQQLRSLDIVGRLGGEEFGVILPNTARAEARCLAERLCQAVSRHEIVTRYALLKMSVSIGVATFGASMQTIDDLSRCADHALYQAKAEGRNRVVVALGEGVPADETPISTT